VWQSTSPGVIQRPRASMICPPLYAEGLKVAIGVMASIVSPLTSRAWFSRAPYGPPTARSNVARRAFTQMRSCFGDSALFIAILSGVIAEGVPLASILHCQADYQWTVPAKTVLVWK